MTRVFLDDAQIRGDTASVAGPDAHHLLHVLRMSVGDTFLVVDDRARERPATIVSITEGRLLAELGPAAEARVEPAVALTLYHGLPRGPRYETALRMCTELGVSGFVPVLSARSIVRITGADVERKRERWQRIVEEAAKQCGRTRIPEVSAPLPWPDALAEFRASGMAGLMPSAGLAGSDAPPLGDAVQALSEQPPARLALFIGPESGFDLEEEAAARDAGVRLVTMGPRILRTETAAMAAAAVCLDRLGEMR